MTLKEKFNSIDQSRITADQKAFLDKMKNVTKDFTLENKEVNDKVEGALDKMIASFKEKMPDAIKTSTKVVVPKTAKSKKTTKVVSKTTTPKRTVMTVAKEIRKEGESWKDAQKRASDIIKEDKAEVSEVVKKELDRINKFINSRAELKGISGTNIKRDAVRTAKPRGVRTVTHSGETSNQYGTFSNKLGRRYWESRDRHADRLAPNYPKDAPLLEEGGYLTDPTFGNFQNSTMFAGGGGVNTKSTFRTNNSALLEYANFTDGSHINLIKLNKPYKNGLSFAVSVQEFKDEQQVLLFKTLDKAKVKFDYLVAEAKEDKTLRDEGKTNNYELGGDFQSGVYAEKGMEVENLDLLIKKGYRFNGGDAFETYEECENIVNNVKSDDVDYIIVKVNSKYPYYAIGEKRNYELGGVMATDLAGHTGGALGTGDPSLLSGNSGTAYTGLVGETGAMSNGEMFMAGGSVEKKIYGIEKDFSPFDFGLYTYEEAKVKSQEYMIEYPNSFFQPRLYNDMRNELPAIERMNMPILDKYGKFYDADNTPFSQGDLKEYHLGGTLPSGSEQSYMITESLGNPAQHYAFGGGFREKNNRKYDIGRNWTNDHYQFDKNSEHEVEYRKRKKFELGGTVVTDLAGHTGGGTGGLDAGMPLSGFSNTSYTGLAGETGAMSSGEMFMNGGTLPDGASQSYMITESLGNPAQHYAIGGAIENQYEGRTPDDVWDNWTEKQKNHFLTDHKNHVYKYGNLYDSIDEKYELINTNYFELPKNLRLAISDHIETGEYKAGGMLDANERYVLEIKGLTGLRKEAIERYIEENRLSDNDVLNIVIGLGRKQLKGTDVASAVVGKKGNALSKEVIEFAKDNRGMKLEEGGNIDAFTLRMVKGTAGNPDEAMAEPRSVQFSGGGGVSERQKKINYLEKLMDVESDVWDELGVSSGSQIRQDENILRKYAEGVKKAMEKESLAYGSLDEGDYEYLEDENSHLFNDFLVWNNYYDPSLTKKEKAWRLRMYNDDVREKGKSIYTSNPEIITVISTKSKSETKSSSNLDRDGFKVKIEEVKATTNGKSELLYGANVFYKDDLIRFFPAITDSKNKLEESIESWFKSLKRFEKGNPQSRNNGDVVVFYTQRGEEAKKTFDNKKDAQDFYDALGKLQNSNKEKNESDKKYIVNADIESVTVKKAGKEVTYSGKDVLNGANILKDGGGIEDKASYFSKNNVVSVKLKNGKTIKPANGYWVEKDATPIKKFDDGGEVTYFVNKDGIKVRSVAKPEKELSEAEWMAKHSESKEARGYATGGGVENKDTWQNLLEGYGFKKSRSKYGIDIYKKRGYVATVDAKERNVELMFDDELIYEGYSVQGLLASLKDEFSSRYGTQGKKMETGGGVDRFSEYSNDALNDMIINLSRYENTESEIKMVKAELEKRKANKKMTTGGKFEKLSKSVAKNYEGKRVKPQYQKEYGKVYSKEEAKEVGDKVAGKVKANQKMTTGGEAKKGGKGAIMILAKEIRKDGEKWTDAVKRAGKQLK